MRPALRALLFSGAAFNPLDLFAGGYDGFYFDFSKTDRTFQEGTGSTLADDATEPVGQALSGRLWGGKTLVEIMATQPGIGGLASNNASVVYSGGVATFTASSFSFGVITPISSITIGKMYEITFRIASISAGSIAPYAGSGGAGTAVNSPGTYTQRLIASGSTRALIISLSASTTAVVDNISVKEIPGNHAIQSTAGSRPTREAGGVLRFNGSAHNLLTALNPSGTLSIVTKVKPNSDADLRVMAGSAAASDGNASFGFDASGNFCASVGADTAATIKGSTNRNGSVCIVGLAYDGQRVHLYENREQTYGDAQNGAANTTVPLRIGANNDNGTAGDFLGGDIYQLLAVNRFLTLSDMQNIVNLWGLS